MEHYLEDFLNLFQDYKIEKHTDDEKGYEFLDVGEYFLTIINPDDAGNLSIRFGKRFTLFFGGWHTEFVADENGYQDLIASIRAIIDCSKCVYCLKFEHKSVFALGKVVAQNAEKGSPPKNILDDIDEFKKIKLKNARLRLIAWQTEFNREFNF